MSEHNISVFLVFFVSLLALILLLSKFRADRPILATLLPEAAMVILVGMTAGFFIHIIIGKRNRNSNDYAGDDDQANDDQADESDDLGALLSFSPEIFFIALLPPIIFNSGLRIGALFVRHITPILLFATIGTTINALSVGMLLFLVHKLGLISNDFNPSLSELFAFGALISSTDPVSTLAVFQKKKVNPQLFYLVFGESVLNDALAIVLFESFKKFVSEENNFGTIAIGILGFAFELFVCSIGSLCLGYASGLFAAFIFKTIDMRHHRLLEISLYIVLMYIPFLIAEILNLSGIVTILFTGAAANRYVVPNLSSVTKVNSDMLFRLLSHLAETSIFLELGLSVFGIIGHWNWSFIGWSFLSLMIGRALNVYPIVSFFNKFLLRDNKDPLLDSTCEGDWDQRVSASQPTQSFMTVETEMTATPFRRKDLKIRPNTANMFWFSGLRGAVSYACVRTFPDTLGHQKDFTMTTMAIILITVFGLGGTTEVALNCFKIDTGVDEDNYMVQTLREPIISNNIRKFEQTYICPRVIREFNPNNSSSARPQSPKRNHTIDQERSALSQSIFYRGQSDDDTFVTQDSMSLFDYGAQVSGRDI